MKAIYPIVIHKFEDSSPHWFATKYSLTECYWVRFESEIISGSAILFPCGNGIEELRSRPSPQSIVAETGVKAYEDFRLLADTETYAERSEPLPNPGDYELTGRVWRVMTDEDGEIFSVKVFIGSLDFDLNKSDLAGIDVEEGAWVRFRVLELALYDANY